MSAISFNFGGPGRMVWYSYSGFGHVMGDTSGAGLDLNFQKSGKMPPGKGPSPSRKQSIAYKLQLKKFHRYSWTGYMV